MSLLVTGTIGIDTLHAPTGEAAGVLGGSCAYFAAAASQLTPVRVVGAVVTQEVIAADCVPGWDTHCSPGCVNTVGNTIRSIDPAALIGG